MAMFARRSIQRMLDELAADISIDGRRKLAHELNRNAPSALGFEWELALLYALRSVGEVEYEAQIESASRRPDLTFRERRGSIRFKADVTTVSDDGLDAENPVMILSQEVFRLRQKYALPGMLHYDVKGEATGPRYGDEKMRLKLPPVSKLRDLLKRIVEPELLRIQREKLETATIVVEEEGVAFTLKYSAKERFGGGRFPSYTAAYSKTRNPVYTSLKAKARQLKSARDGYPLGIFLCDGGCQLRGNTQRYVANFNVMDVIGEFFRQYSSIAFVAVLVFPPTRSEIFTGIVKERRITGQLYLNRTAVEAPDQYALLTLINRGLALLPTPAATPRDALHQLKRYGFKNAGYIHELIHGGGMMSETIKISARKVQELLAGKLTPSELFKDYARPGEKFENPFQNVLRGGLILEAINLTRNTDVDDDLLEFRFGPPDPAISKIAVKEADPTKS